MKRTAAAMMERSAMPPAASARLLSLLSGCAAGFWAAEAFAEEAFRDSFFTVAFLAPEAAALIFFMAAAVRLPISCEIASSEKRGPARW